MSLVNGHSSFSNATSNYSHEVTFALSGNSSERSSRVFEVVSKPIGYVLGEQLRNFCTFIYSKLPTFSLPGATATELRSVSSCSDELNLRTSEATGLCETPIGSYEESCNKPKVTYNPETRQCHLKTRCETIYEGLPHQANEMKFEPQKSPLVLENRNGTLSIAGESEKEADKQLGILSQALREVDEKLRHTEIGKKEREELETQKERVLEEQSKIIRRLNAGDIISFNKDKQLVVITPENQMDHKRLYDSEALSTFRQLAISTGGIMGLSPSAEFLPQVIEKTFEHILHSVESDESYDIAFVLDTTISMNDDIESVKQSLIDFLRHLKSKKANTFRVALLEYRDSGDLFLNRVNADFTPDLDKLENKLLQVTVEGGGDHSEAVLDALLAAQKDLSWRDDTRHVVILIGDAPPHLKTVDEAYDEKAVIGLYKAKNTQIAVYPIVANQLKD